MILTPGTHIRHLVRGSSYEVLPELLEVQHSGGDRSLDGEVLVRYRDLKSGKVFGRLPWEFEGRFEVISSPGVTPPSARPLPPEIVAEIGVVEGFAGPKCVIFSTKACIGRLRDYFIAHNDPEAKRTGAAGRWCLPANGPEHAVSILQMGGIALVDYETFVSGVDFSQLAQVGLLAYEQGSPPSDEVLLQAAGRFDRLGSSVRVYRVAFKP